MHLSNNIPRRRLLQAGLVLPVSAFLGTQAFGFSVEQARALIQQAIDDINGIINSGKSEAAMLKDFEGIFEKYADGPVIGQLVLGPDGRTATDAQKSNFAKAFQSYISHKYGRRFREFIGGRLEITNAQTVKNFYEITTTAYLAGQAPFEVGFVVADKNGRFIDMKIEGISLVKAERAEIGAMLDQRRGNLDQLISDLRAM